MPLTAYELMSNVPPPASATRNPCLEGFYSIAEAGRVSSIDMET